MNEFYAALANLMMAKSDKKSEAECTIFFKQGTTQTSYLYLFRIQS